MLRNSFLIVAAQAHMSRFKNEPPCLLPDQHVVGVVEPLSDLSSMFVKYDLHGLNLTCCWLCALASLTGWSAPLLFGTRRWKVLCSDDAEWLLPLSYLTHAMILVSGPRGTAKSTVAIAVMGTLSGRLRRHYRDYPRYNDRVAVVIIEEASKILLSDAVPLSLYPNALTYLLIGGMSIICCASLL